MAQNSTIVILAVGTVGGLVAFAISHAIVVWRRRHRSVGGDHGNKSGMPIFAKLSLVGALIFLAGKAFYIVTPHNIGEYQGLLVGEGLYAVSDMLGYAAEFPNNAHRVKAGDPLVLFYRNPSPREVQQATQELAILTQKLKTELLREPQIDPFVLSQYEGLGRRLELAAERERQLIRQRDLALVSNKNSSRLVAQELRRVNEELTSARFQLEQRVADLNVAKQAFESISSDKAKNLISKVESVRIAERHEQAQSQLAERMERVRSLEQRQVALEDRQGHSADDTADPIVNTIDEWLAELHDEKARLTASYAELQEKLEVERGRAALRREANIQQIKIQLENTTALVESFDAGYRAGSPIVTRAPWEGLVGFRSTSPSNPVEQGRPIVALYRPEQVWVRVRVPEGAADRLEDQLDIRIRDNYAPGGATEFEGKIIDRRNVDVDKVEVRIACEPPAQLVRRLAQGEAVTLNVTFNWPGMSVSALASSFKDLHSTMAEAADGGLPDTIAEAIDKAQPDSVLAFGAFGILTMSSALVLGRRRRSPAPSEPTPGKGIEPPVLAESQTFASPPSPLRTASAADAPLDNADFILDLTIASAKDNQMPSRQVRRGLEVETGA
jgi:hypothetical protein